MKNLSSILTSSITGFIVLSGSFAWFIMLLVALNGFTERQAKPVLMLHMGLSLVCVLAFGIVAVWLKNFIIRKKSWKVTLASVLSILIGSIAGLAVVCGVSLIAVAIAEKMISK